MAASKSTKTINRRRERLFMRDDDLRKGTEGKEKVRSKKEEKVTKLKCYNVKSAAVRTRREGIAAGRR